MKRLLGIGDFRNLWLSHVISSFGDALTNLALLILAQRLTGSTAAVATTAVAVALPQLLFGLFAGVLVDRWNRKFVMIASDLARAFLVLGFSPSAHLSACGCSISLLSSRPRSARWTIRPGRQCCRR